MEITNYKDAVEEFGYGLMEAVLLIMKIERNPKLLEIENQLLDEIYENKLTGE